MNTRHAGNTMRMQSKGRDAQQVRVQRKVRVQSVVRDLDRKEVLNKLRGPSAKQAGGRCRSVTWTRGEMENAFRYSRKLARVRRATILACNHARETKSANQKCQPMR